MAKDDRVKSDTKGMDDLIKMLTEQNLTLRVGILGSKAKGEHDGESGLTNAEIGTFHEFGTVKMPRRSFLEDSLKLKLKFNTEEMKEIKKKVWNNIFVKNEPKKFFEDLGAKCLDIIEEAFATNGFGNWKPLSETTQNKRLGKIKRRSQKEYNYWAKHPILTDTGKLRRSISFKVLKNEQQQ